MSMQTFAVSGMTCNHCVAAVREEIGTLSGVSDVTVDLDADGVSTVHVTSENPLADEQVAAALDEAGDYRLA
jgi:copper ion binding protein